GVEEAEARLLGRQRRRSRQVRHTLSYLRHELDDVRRRGAELGRELAGIGVADAPAQDLRPGPEGRRSVVLVAAAAVDARAALPGDRAQLLRGPRLSDAGLAD